MPPSVIDRIHSKAQGQPAQLIFTLQGVMFPAFEESAKFPGVDGNQDYMDHMPEPDLDMGHNGNRGSRIRTLI